MTPGRARAARHQQALGPAEDERASARTPAPQPGRRRPGRLGRGRPVPRWSWAACGWPPSWRPPSTTRPSRRATPSTFVTEPGQRALPLAGGGHRVGRRRGRRAGRLAVAGRERGLALAGQAGLRGPPGTADGPGPAEPAALHRPQGCARGAPSTGAGLQVGRDVMGGRMVRATWEDTLVAIAGARMGKTTSMAVPQVLDAPGVVYCTSNKRDLLDLTRKARAKAGPGMGLRPPGDRRHRDARSSGGTPSTPAGTSSGPGMIADVFASASRPPNATRDSYFDPAGEELLATYLLAAAAGKRAGNGGVPLGHQRPRRHPRRPPERRRAPRPFGGGRGHHAPA